MDAKKMYDEGWCETCTFDTELCLTAGCCQGDIPKKEE